VIGEWVKKRESGGVGGDPVGSTDPEVSSKSHPCTKWRAKNALCANSGVKRRLCPFLAFNAKFLPFTGV